MITFLSIRMFKLLLINTLITTKRVNKVELLLLITRRLMSYHGYQHTIYITIYLLK